MPLFEEVGQDVVFKLAHHFLAAIAAVSAFEFGNMIAAGSYIFPQARQDFHAQ